MRRYGVGPTGPTSSRLISILASVSATGRKTGERGIVKVYIALPAYTGTTRVETTMALCEELQIMNKMGIDAHLMVNAGDSILPRCRNMFLRDFYNRKEFDHFFFLDHDITWQAGAMVRMLKHQVDFVAGVYPKRSDPVEFPIRWLESREKHSETGLIEVEGVPTGFMRLSRNCVEGMMDRYWSLSYQEDGLDPPVAIALCDFMVVNGQYVGEDYALCRRWREMGGKIWLDPDIAFNHIGFKRFEGRGVGCTGGRSGQAGHQGCTDDG
jgi:hypothetical protein